MVDTIAFTTLGPVPMEPLVGEQLLGPHVNTGVRTVPEPNISGGNPAGYAGAMLGRSQLWTHRPVSCRTVSCLA